MVIGSFRGLVLAGMMILSAFMAGCSGSSGSNSSQIVDPTDPPESPATPPEQEPPAEEEPPVEEAPPTAEMSVAEDVVATDEPVVLTWSSSNADECRASGGWNGTRGVSGTASVGTIEASTTFTLTCSGPGGSAVAMLSVSVYGTLTLNWQPPSENVDGTPLDDLAGYRIYFGPDSRDYSDQVAINGSDVTSQDVVLASGSYYFAMTALDVDGNESAYSNEVVKVVN